VKEYERKVARARVRAQRGGRFGAKMPIVTGVWRAEALGEAWGMVVWTTENAWYSLRRWRAIRALTVAQRRLPWWDLHNTKAIEVVKARIMAEDLVWRRLVSDQNDRVGKRLDAE
jgi:hypothetical protein